MIRTGHKGETAISSSPSVGSYPLARMVTDFVLAHPAARVDLRITNPTEAINAVRTGHSAFAVSLLDPTQLVGDLTVEILWVERYLLVCAHDS